MGVRVCSAHLGGKTLFIVPFVVTWAVTVTSLFLMEALFFYVAEAATPLPERAFARSVIYTVTYIIVTYNYYSICPKRHLA